MSEGREQLQIYLVQETGTSPDTAKVVIDLLGERVAVIVARIQHEAGADGGMYPVVKLEEVAQA